MNERTELSTQPQRTTAHGPDPPALAWAVTRTGSAATQIQGAHPGQQKACFRDSQWTPSALVHRSRRSAAGTVSPWEAAHRYTCNTALAPWKHCFTKINKRKSLHVSMLGFPKHLQSLAGLCLRIWKPHMQGCVKTRVCRPAASSHTLLPALCPLYSASLFCTFIFLTSETRSACTPAGRVPRPSPRVGRAAPVLTTAAW